ncbi:MAG: hypothetical protein NWQ54_06630 [Paraglaciecola sp.]|nr:hypothetical protein [Paraglaciecola sp.]
MGGFGSGRRHNGKAVISSYLYIDVAQLKKAGVLVPGTEFSLLFKNGRGEIAAEAEDNAVWFSYAIRQGETYKDQLYKVPLSFTFGKLGGKRAWFLCPFHNCDKRVTKLYIAHRLGCRHCLGLSHQSKNESHMDRMARKADNIRVKLGWPEGILNPEGLKPKGMHYLTYQRLVKRYRELRNIAILAIADEFPMLQHLKDNSRQ